ncbi:hypothetical protein CLU97_3359 [Chryseobacterium sp. 7]|jgi:hypothetical protein|uniref:hypothetical protein n=1 Tax=Chryseobacterium sp. 7 TaxID=2035214 RepID=UPI000EB2148E|nr:hypothetical protein [Chryseobacterium sp. 7]RLJ33870.1 hypothetical protein CLU97_3359 [Chryseobacterium sp. 7]
MKKLLLLFIPLAVAFSCGSSDDEPKINNNNQSQTTNSDLFGIVGKYRVYASSDANNPNNTFTVSSGCMSNWTIEFKTDKTFVENKPTLNPCKDNIMTGTYGQWKYSPSSPDSIISIKYDYIWQYGWPSGLRLYRNTKSDKSKYDYKLIRGNGTLYTPYNINYYLKKM